MTSLNETHKNAVLPSAITVTNLGKAYKQYPTRWARLTEWVLPGKKLRHTLKWVLQDINFNVQPGEAVGIVGINGAGKSTLLKMITGTTQPTSGSVQLHGRVAALLELGMGFHPDFTGRQNVIMSGQLLGYSVEEMTYLMPEIEAFAEIGDYIDQPVRVYSSGMQMRLAFSVATAQPPDVLIVDEALSVGDAAFQRKCFRRIEQFRESDTAFLFVSHDVETVKKLCNKAILLNNGIMESHGFAKHVCDMYEKLIFSDANTEKSSNSSFAQLDSSLIAKCANEYGNGKAQILNIRMEDKYENSINVVQTGVNFHIVFDVLILSNTINKPFLNMQIKTTDGVVVYGVNSNHLRFRSIPAKNGDKFRTRFSLENHLAPGTYFVNCGFKEQGTDDEEFCHRIVDAAILKIIGRPNSTVARGILDMCARIDVLLLAAEEK